MLKKPIPGELVHLNVISNQTKLDEKKRKYQLLKSQAISGLYPEMRRKEEAERQF